MKIKLLIIILLISTGVFAQSVEIPTYERLEDGTYRKIIKSSTEDAEVFDSATVYNEMIRQIDRAYFDVNRLLNNLFQVRKIGRELEKEFTSLFGDDYTDFVQRWDTTYANPLTPINEFTYESTLRIGADTTYNIHVFVNGAGNQIFRIQGDTTNTNYALRHIEYNTMLRLGSAGVPFPEFSGPILLEKVDVPNTNFRVYRRVTDDNTTVTLRIRIPDDN